MTVNFIHPKYFTIENAKYNGSKGLGNDKLVAVLFIMCSVHIIKTSVIIVSPQFYYLSSIFRQDFVAIRL